MKKVNRSSSGKNNLDRRVKKPANKTGKTDKLQYGNGKHTSS